MNRLRALALSALACALFACGAPLRNVVGHPLLVDGTPTLQEAEQLIRAGAGVKGWVVEKEAEGVLVASLALRGHQVTVEIRHDARQFDVTYRASEDMDYDGTGRIHQNYNRWVNTMVEDISGLEIHEAGSARWVK